MNLSTPIAHRFGAIYTLKPFERDAAMADSGITASAAADAQYTEPDLVAEIKATDPDAFLRTAWFHQQLAQTQQHSKTAQFYDRYRYQEQDWNQLSAEQRNQAYAADAGHQQFQAALFSLLSAYNRTIDAKAGSKNPLAGESTQQETTLETKKQMAESAKTDLLNAAGRMRNSNFYIPQAKTHLTLLNLPPVENGVTPELKAVLQQLNEIPYHYPLDLVL